MPKSISIEPSNDILMKSSCVYVNFPSYAKSNSILFEVSISILDKDSNTLYTSSVSVVAFTLYSFPKLSFKITSLFLLHEVRKKGIMLNIENIPKFIIFLFIRFTSYTY